MPRANGKKQAKSVEIYETLREEIIAGKLRPGDSLAEEAVADRLGTSRTPVREALYLLRSEGWVQADNVGRVTVAGLSMGDLRELFELRRTLEACSARLAASSSDRLNLAPFLQELDEAREAVAKGNHEDYHELMTRVDEAIVSLSNNGRLAAALSDVWTHLSRVRAVTCTDSQRLNESIDRRLDVVKAIVAGDSAQAERLAADHVDQGFAVTVERIAFGSDSGATLSVAS